MGERLGRYCPKEWQRPSDLIVQIWGANTNVGKTLVSCGLCRAHEKRVNEEKTKPGGSFQERTWYVKPVQTGPHPWDAHKVRSLCGAMTSTIFSAPQPVSPHLAARPNPPDDSSLIQSVASILDNTAPMPNSCLNEADTSLCVVETAGGVLSPSPSGSLQADLFKSLRLDALLIGDGTLGGIGASLQAYESLILRGYTVRGIVLLERDDSSIGTNTEFIQDYFMEKRLNGKQSNFVGGEGNREAFVRSLPLIPSPDVDLKVWIEESEEYFDDILSLLFEAGRADFDEKSSLASRAKERIWWPFTQHRDVNASSITTIDSAFGDYYHTIETKVHNDSRGNRRGQLLRKQPLFDMPASWWTQGVGHGDIGMAMAVGSAAGRYGHVILPGMAHAPAVRLAERSCSTLGKSWATKAFFSDNGSTAMEVALKMAYRLFSVRHKDCEKLLQSEGHKKMAVVTQADCYHGDTLGVMDMAPPSIFNQSQHPWYEPRSLALQVPRAAWKGGRFVVSASPDNGGEELAELASVNEAFDWHSRDSSQLAERYKQEVLECISAYEISHPDCILGALILEPVFVGSGGMYLVDPLFQRVLVKECRNLGMSIVYDEVFAGCWRLGVPSCVDLLGVSPDIAAYAKLLTGGVMPLSLTLATEETFEGFMGDSKAEALLHGHSFTGNPLGCAAALYALDRYESGDAMQCEWPETRVAALSNSPKVVRSVALGTCLAVELASSDGTGYASTEESTKIGNRLRNEYGLFARVLGPVIYALTSPGFTSDHDKNYILNAIENLLEE
eukprot:354192_1